MLAKLGQGIYTPADAARLTRLRPRTIRDWFLGRATENRRRVLVGNYEPVGTDYSISFHDLVDVFVAGQLRQNGVRLRTIRRVYARLQDDLGQKHPFCHQRLATDGREVFVRLTDTEGIEELVEVLTRQKVFPQIIQPFLKQIDYHRVTDLATRWRIAAGVVVDPRVCFGKPSIEGVGVKTWVLATAYEANGRDEEKVAWWYNVAVEDVRAAVRFEAGLAA